MIAKLLGLLKGEPQTAAQLLQSIEETEAALPAAEASVARLTSERAAGLLELPDADIVQIEARLATAIRDRDRLSAALAELNRRYAIATEREDREQLEAQRQELNHGAERLAARLRLEYPRAARTLVDLLKQVEDAEGAIRAHNVRVTQAGRSDLVIAGVEERVIPSTITSGANTAGFIATTSLRPVDDLPGWGAAVQSFEISGATTKLL